MRLTLRTLLAWLDDTLSPSEVREIGKQVSESPFAKELVEKIHRVTRQRRLTIPPLKGPDSVDANIVASYLDNELDPDAVAELEKKCLISDVHLAEVASVHQVLSLIGQKAKVPVEARHRMYQLIKGREAVKPQGSRASRQTEPRPMTEPVQPWISAPLPPRPLLKQYGVPAAVVGLMALLCLTAWNTLSTTDDSSQGTGPLVAVASNVGAPTVVPKTEKKPEKTDDATAKTPSASTDSGEPSGSRARRKRPPRRRLRASKPADVPAGSVGMARKAAGVLLRFNPDPLRREWGKTDGCSGSSRNRIGYSVSSPSAPRSEIGTADIDLVSGTEVWAARPSRRTRAADAAPRGRRASRHEPGPAVRGPVRRQDGQDHTSARRHARHRANLSPRTG